MSRRPEQFTVARTTLCSGQSCPPRGRLGLGAVGKNAHPATRWHTQQRTVPIAVVLVAVALGSGCESGPAGAPPETPPPSQQEIIALQPHEMAEQVTRRPTFKWKLPPKVAGATLVSFALAEAGDGDRPVLDESDRKRVGFASGLHAESPDGINPWNPPPGCVLTGKVRDMTQLKADTWYCWSVRALSDTGAARAAFHFRTRSEPAAPAP